MALSKFSMAAGGVGAIGVAGVGITVWQVSGHSGISPENIPFSADFKNRPNAADLGLSVNSESAQIDRSYGCFSSFFGGLTITTASDANDSNTAKNIDSLQNAQPQTVQTQEKPIGCMLMQLSYDLNDMKKPRWVFKGEITAKNGNIGWALWMSGYGGTVDQGGFQYDQKMYYRLALLEKTNEDTWTIKTGLGWEDTSFLSTSYFRVYVVDPNGKIWMDKNVGKNELDDFVGLKENPQVHVHSYSGVWEIGREGHEIFRNIDIRSTKSAQEYLLGRDGGFGKDVNVQTIYEDNTWKSFGEDSAHIISKDILNKWYEPFKGKRGKWVEIEDYCNLHKTACGHTQ